MILPDLTWRDLPENSLGKTEIESS